VLVDDLVPHVTMMPPGRLLEEGCKCNRSAWSAGRAQDDAPPSVGRRLARPRVTKRARYRRSGSSPPRPLHQWTDRTRVPGGSCGGHRWRWLLGPSYRVPRANPRLDFGLPKGVKADTPRGGAPALARVCRSHCPPPSAGGDWMSRLFSAVPGAPAHPPRSGAPDGPRCPPDGGRRHARRGRSHPAVHRRAGSSRRPHIGGRRCRRVAWRETVRGPEPGRPLAVRSLV
jgi:hypothetical protein